MPLAVSGSIFVTLFDEECSHCDSDDVGIILTMKGNTNILRQGIPKGEVSLYC